MCRPGRTRCSIFYRHWCGRRLRNCRASGLKTSRWCSTTCGSSSRPCWTPTVCEMGEGGFCIFIFAVTVGGHRMSRPKWKKPFVFRAGPVKFNVNILNGSGDFELTEGGSLTVSGRVAAYDENAVDDYRLEHHHPTTTATSDKWDLDADDFYKELRLRGYQYKDAFLGFVGADGDGE